MHLNSNCTASRFQRSASASRSAVSWSALQGAQRASTSMTERVTTRAAASSGAAWSSDPKPSSRNMGVILEKSPINSTPVRLLALLAAVTLGGVGTSFLPASAAAAVVHVLAAGTWVGINLWTTFFAGITMFKNLERQTFGKLQAKLFPLYFALTTFCCAILLGTSTHFESVITNKVTGTLILGLVTSLANLVFIEPKATSVMFERYQLENSGSKDPEARKKLTSQFGKLHGLSSIANLGNLFAAIAHCTWLGIVLESALV